MINQSFNPSILQSISIMSIVEIIISIVVLIAAWTSIITYCIRMRRKPCKWRIIYWD